MNVLLVVVCGILNFACSQKEQVPLTLALPTIPSLGFGTWNLDKSNVSDAVSLAIQVGYRHLDCAAAYGNEKDVGRGIEEGLRKAGLKRGDIWVTSKLWNDRHKSADVSKGLEQTLSDLRLEYLDLYLMHWPVATSSAGVNSIDFIDAWKGLVEVYRLGKARNIGVSNFNKKQLESLIRSSSVQPAVHQMELHPYLQQNDWVKWHKAHSIEVTAYSPFANMNPTYDSPHGDPKAPLPLLQNPSMLQIAKESGCTAAQVALAWGISRNTSVIPKASRTDHIQENYGVLNCMLNQDAFNVIDNLGITNLKRFNNPSRQWGVDLFNGLEGVSH